MMQEQSREQVKALGVLVVDVETRIQVDAIMAARATAGVEAVAVGQGERNRRF